MISYDIVVCDFPGLVKRKKVISPREVIKLIALTRGFYPQALASVHLKGHNTVTVQTTPELLVYRRDVFPELGLVSTNIAETLKAAKNIST